MKAVYVGLWLSLLGSAAMAQTAPNTAPTPPAPNAPAPKVGAQGATGPQADGSDEPYEGEIIQTPNGTWMVTRVPDQSEAQNEDHVPPHPGPEAADEHPHHHPIMTSKAAHFRMKGPDLAVDVKCPDEESVKACTDAIAALMDKVAVHH